MAQKLWVFMGCFLYFLLITAGVPFFWSDHVNNSFAAEGWSYELLGKGFEFYFRPVENLTYYLSYTLFGISAVAMHFFKALIAAGVCVWIYHYVDDKKMGILAVLFFITAQPVLESITYIYDFEIVANVFLLSALYFFLKAYEKAEWKSISLFVLLTILALLTKETAKVFVGVLIIFVLLTKRERLKVFALPFLLLLFVAVKPGFLLGLDAPTSTFIMSIYSWSTIDNLWSFIAQFFLLTWSFFFFLMYSAYKGKRDETQKLFVLYFIATAAIVALLPSAGEKRYLLVPLLPFFIFAFITVKKTYPLFSKRIKIFFWIIIIAGLCINSTLSLKYRYAAGNFFTALEEVHAFAEERYHDALFLYFDSSTHYMIWKTNNTIIGYDESRIGTSMKTLLFALHGLENDKEKIENATLLKTAVHGPYCMMVYEWTNETVQEYLTEQEESKWFYVFNESREENSCSVMIRGKFLVTDTITIKRIGDLENTSITIDAPNIKTNTCEYLCPEFNNSETKTEKIEVLVPNNYGSTVESVSLRYGSK